MKKQTRKEQLATFVKQATQDKVASDVASDVNLAEIDDPEEYAHKVFEALLSNLKIEGLDE
jgi:hypothetical protein